MKYALTLFLGIIVGFVLWQKADPTPTPAIHCEPADNVSILEGGIYSIQAIYSRSEPNITYDQGLRSMRVCDGGGYLYTRVLRVDELMKKKSKPKKSRKVSNFFSFTPVVHGLGTISPIHTNVEEAGFCHERRMGDTMETYCIFAAGTPSAEIASIEFPHRLCESKVMYPKYTLGNGIVNSKHEQTPPPREFSLQINKQFGRNIYFSRLVKAIEETEDGAFYETMKDSGPLMGNELASPGEILTLHFTYPFCTKEEDERYSKL